MAWVDEFRIVAILNIVKCGKTDKWTLHRIKFINVCENKHTHQ